MVDKHSGSFEVDVPVTNLDAPEDDEFRLDDDEINNDNNHLYDDDNVSIGMNLFDGPESFTRTPRSILRNLANRMKRTFRVHGGAGDGSGDYGYLESIEMFDRNNDHHRSNTSFADLEDLDNVDLIREKKKKHRKTLLTFAALIGTLVLLGIFSYNFGAPVLGSTSPPDTDSNNSKPQTDIDETNKMLLNNGTHNFYPTTVLISLDGFHPHYISKENTPFMHRLLANKGYGPPYMIASNPTVTFVNHWTLATGLKPLYHGIIANHFFDPAMDELYISTNESLSMRKEWWGGDPLWSVAGKQGLRTAVHMWPGSEADLSPERMNAYDVDSFNGTEVLSNKVQRLLSWIDRPLDTRPELILSYVPNIDSVGHAVGVSGNLLIEELNYVDAFLEDFYLGLHERSLTHLVNVVIVSDHGMSPTSDDRLIYLDDLIDVKQIEYFDGWPLFGLRPFEKYKVKDVYRQLKNSYESHPLKDHFEVHLREDVLEELFGGKDSSYVSRVAPIWVIPKIGYSITTKEKMKDREHYGPKGVHGYDNNEVLMRSLFLATGPYFEKKLGDTYKLKPFSNTEVYNIVCDSIGITPSPNNGTSNSSYIQKANALADNWIDEFVYPNVTFDIDILTANATVDLLWGNNGDDISDKYDGSNDEETTHSIPPASSRLAYPSSSRLAYPSASIYRSSTIATVTTTGRPDSGKDGDKYYDNNVGDVDDDVEEGYEDEDDQDDDEDDKTVHKGKWGSLGDSMSDMADDISDEVEDLVEEVGDFIQDGWNSVLGNDKDDDDESDDND